MSSDIVVLLALSLALLSTGPRNSVKKIGRLKTLSSQAHVSGSLFFEGKHQLIYSSLQWKTPHWVNDDWGFASFSLRAVVA
jgi:hypothetical protein